MPQRTMSAALANNTVGVQMTLQQAGRGPFLDDDLTTMLDVTEFRAHMPMAGSGQQQQRTDFNNVSSNLMASPIGAQKRYYSSSDFEEDSGFCSNLTPPAAKMARYDEDSCFTSNSSNLTPLVVPKQFGNGNIDFSDCYSNSNFPPLKGSGQVAQDSDVMLLRTLIKEAAEQPSKLTFTNVSPNSYIDETSNSSFSTIQYNSPPYASPEKQSPPPQQVLSPMTPAKFSVNYPSRSRNGLYELRIMNQPEDQHRARYLTEGSRGSIKDKSGLGHPVVKLFGHSSVPLKLQCYIGHDRQLGAPHLFYQASKISGKNSTRCDTSKIEGVTIVTVDLEPESDMMATIDCIGILKERNVDVEQKLLRLKTSENIPAVPTKKRSTKCRLVFRVELPSGEILQTISNPILCTQPLGTPEVLKKSLTEGPMCGGQELFIIGKNFLKDSKVIWSKGSNWSKVVEPDREYQHATHLVAQVPPYEGPEAATQSRVDVTFYVQSGGKLSDCQTFTYVNSMKATNLPQQQSASTNVFHSVHLDSTSLEDFDDSTLDFLDSFNVC